MWLGFVAIGCWTFMIEIHQLFKTFRAGHREVLAVNGVSFHVAAGEVYGLLGPNGAGKTTTMRMILGLLRPDSGWAEINGARTSDQSDQIKRQVGFVSASAGLYQWLTTREMLSFFGDVYGLSPKFVKDRIEQLSILLDLKSFLNQRCSTLSTGQRQRANLARALIHDPPVMILDEPTLGLDVVGSQVIFEYISMLKVRAKAIILCTHRLEQAERVCDRFGLLHEGNLVHEGTLAELMTRTGKQHLVDIFVGLIKHSDSSAAANVETEGVA
jgi:ABC-2 type transport system ATP-binding protein/sodium transport system ATP-binding protein